MIAGREPLVLAVALWAFVFLQETLVVPQAAPLSLLMSVIGVLNCLALAALLVMARRRPAVPAVALGLAGLALAVAVQVGVEMASTLALGPRVLGRAQGVPGWAIPQTLDDLIFIAPMRIMANAWIFGIFALVLVLLHNQKRELDTRLRAQAAEMEALQLQLGPHFLFNALGSLEALVALGRKDEAGRMIHHLIDFFRSTLLGAREAEGPLEEEIERVRDYLAIEQARHGARLILTIDWPEDLAQAVVPSLILQPLAENAVVHAVALSDTPVRISLTVGVRDQALILTVANTLPETIRGEHDGTGTGLRNVRDRLDVLYGPAAALQAERLPDRFEARIIVPLRLPVQG